MKTSSQANPAPATVPPVSSPAGEFPRMFRLRQRLPTASPVDFAAGLGAALAWREVLAALKPGARVAVAVGSRGIANLSEIVAALLAGLRAAGARPFVVPAMGSHGGATAAGQREILAEYGITEADRKSVV